MYNKWLIYSLLLAFLGVGCLTSQNVKSDQNEQTGDPESAFKLIQQKAPPRQIQSVQLYRKGSPQNPPVISLEDSEKLILKFDYLESSSSQFRFKVTHRNKDWSQSSLSPNFFLDGLNETSIINAQKSFSQRPSYFHYEYEFPNREFSFNVSGNYLLSVYDYETGNELFSLPFFVTENKGSLSTEVRTRFVRRDDLRPQHQLFSRYRYPSFIKMPQFDLTFYYAQNQFWGRAQKVTIFDTASPNEINFHQDPDQAFLANFEFNMVDLTSFSVDGERILDIDRSTIPPEITLRRDVQRFQSTSHPPASRFGLPLDNRNASYAEVLFRLEPGTSIDESTKIYLVGDFNQWIISEQNRMYFNEESNLWEGNAFIKQGEYAYKYIAVRNGTIDELKLDQGFLRTQQQYSTFVYYRDPQRNYDRLLNVIHQTGN